MNTQNLKNTSMGMGAQHGNTSMGISTHPGQMMRQGSLGAIGQDLGLGMPSQNRLPNTSAPQPSNDFAASLGVDFNFGALDGSLGTDSRKRGADSLGGDGAHSKRGKSWNNGDMNLGNNASSGGSSSDNTLVTMNI